MLLGFILHLAIVYLPVPLINAVVIQIINQHVASQEQGLPVVVPLTVRVHQRHAIIRYASVLAVIALRWKNRAQNLALQVKAV